MKKKENIIRIGINLRMTSGKKCGIGTYSELLYKLLKLNEKKLGIKVIGHYKNLGDIFYKNKILRYLGPIFLDYFWKQFTLPFVCFFNRIDIFLSPSQPAPFWLPCKNIVFINDISKEFESKSLLRKILKKYVIPLSCHRADLIITISNTSRLDIIREYKIEETKIKVLYLTYNKNVFTKLSNRNQIKRQLNLDKYKYIFMSVFSSMNKRKNPGLIFRFFHNFKYNKESLYLIFGPPDGKINYINWCTKNRTKKLPNIKFLSNLSDSKLNKYYNIADFFIIPSLHEGFGLPILEALAVGTKNIIVSNIAVFKEIFSEKSKQIQFFNPFQKSDLNRKVLIAMDKNKNYNRDLILRKYSNRIFLERFIDLIYLTVRNN